MQLGVVSRIADDVRRERRVRRRGVLPPGSLAPSWSHTRPTMKSTMSLTLFGRV